jgi:hypothetical protein
MNWLDTQDLSGVTVLVTHQVNITALTGVVPGSGAMIIVRRSTPGTLSIVGTINPQ